MRAAILDVEARTSCVRSAAKGAGRRGLMLRATHCATALVPVVTAGGLQLGVLVGGTVIVEQVFASQGSAAVVNSSPSTTSR